MPRNSSAQRRRGERPSPLDERARLEAGERRELGLVEVAASCATPPTGARVLAAHLVAELAHGGRSSVTRRSRSRVPVDVAILDAPRRGGAVGDRGDDEAAARPRAVAYLGVSTVAIVPAVVCDRGAPTRSSAEAAPSALARRRRRGARRRARLRRRAAALDLDGPGRLGRRGAVRRSAPGSPRERVSPRGVVAALAPLPLRRGRVVRDRRADSSGSSPRPSGSASWTPAPSPRSPTPRWPAARSPTVRRDVALGDPARSPSTRGCSPPRRPPRRGGTWRGLVAVDVAQRRTGAAGQRRRSVRRAPGRPRRPAASRGSSGRTARCPGTQR